MDVNTFEIVGKTENKARLFFKKYCWRNSLVFVHDVRLVRYIGLGVKISL